MLVWSTTMAASRSRKVVKIAEGDLRLMRIFRVVAECGGLTAAEKKLNMERSTISRHLKALEHRLNGVLCIRGPSGFQLTDFGLIVLQTAISASDLLDQVSEELNAARTLLTGELIVGIADNCISNPAARLPDAIAMFRMKAPTVKLQIVIRPPRQLIEELLTRHLHLCIVGRPPSDEKLSFQYLFSEDFHLYAGTTNGESAPSLDRLVSEGWTMVTRDNDRYTRALMSHLGQNVQAVGSGLEAVATFLSAGGHVGFLPDHYANMLAERIPLQRVFAADPFEYSIPFHLTAEVARPLSAQARLFSEILVQAHMGILPH